MLLSNRHHFMIWKLSEMVVSGNRSIISQGNFTASPRSPLDMKFQSPGSSKRYNNGEIGLGIVAALEKSDIGTNPVSYSGSGWNRSDPVRCARRSQFPVDIDLSEEYTCVTSRDGQTKVYYNDDEFEFCKNTSDGVHRDRRWKKSMEIAEELAAEKREALRDSPDFLSSCCLCKKKLQGKDIYMYKGDKGFCSKECRSVTIMEDNLKRQHNSRTVEALSSPYAGGEVSLTILEKS